MKIALVIDDEVQYDENDNIIYRDVAIQPNLVEAVFAHMLEATRIPIEKFGLDVDED